MNVMTDDLKPSTFGEFIDALIIANIRMWHAQELVYETETLQKFTREEMFNFLKKSTWLNLERNHAMDSLDASLAAAITAKAPLASNRPSAHDDFDRPPLWEQA